MSYIEHVLLCRVGRFSRVDIDVSAPIVPLRETIVPPPTTDRVNELIETDVNRQQADNCTAQPCKTVAMTTVNQQCVVHIRAVPLPSDVLHSLVQHAHLVKVANRLSSAVTSADKSDVLRSVSEHVSAELQQLRLRLDSEFTAAAAAGTAADETWSTAVDRIWSLSRNGTNVLLNGVEGYERPALWSGLDGLGGGVGSLREYDSAVVSGFQIAAQNGPLCEEPMMGVCFIVEKWSVADTDTNLTAVSDQVRFAQCLQYMYC